MNTSQQIRLTSEKTQVVLNEKGQLIKSVHGKTITSWSQEALLITINRQEINVFDFTVCNILQPQDSSVTFLYDHNLFSISVHHELTQEGFYRRIPAITCKTDAQITDFYYEIRPGMSANECIEYKTFWNASTCLFIRYAAYGFALGMEHPFFQSGETQGKVYLRFSPGLVLKRGEVFSFEALFLCACTLSGEMHINDDRGAFLPSKLEGTDRYRFRNPCGHIPLDANEIALMRRYIAQYLCVKPRDFTVILYMYWYPIAQMPGEDAQVCEYLRLLDRFHSLGGEMVIFNPMYPYRKPDDSENGIWNLAPEGSGAQKVFSYARSLGLRIGTYMGVAAHGNEGNACALPFCPERKEWKKVWNDGCLSDENCIADESFRDWWFDVQARTIRAYSLDLWCWDPGPGNAAQCYATNHGHLPGQGEYLGFNASIRFLRRLREAFPDLYLMSYYGRKEFGPWGFKYFDQQEGYWEQTPLICASLHPDMHDDRINAHGVRLQNGWNQMFRFLPPQMNHALVHRISEFYFNPETVKLWDMGGWRFAVLSAVACSGSITLDLLPASLDNVPGMVSFYKRWIAWARENMDTLPNAVPIGGQVQAGRFDGMVRIHGKKGTVFLFNSAPVPVEDHFILNEQTNFAADHAPIALRMLYPYEGQYLWNATGHSGTFASNDLVPVRLEPYEVQVWEIAYPDTAPLLYGIPGTAALEGGRIRLDAPPLPAGASFRIVTDRDADALVIGDEMIPFSQKQNADRTAYVANGFYCSNSVWHWTDETGQAFPILTNPDCEQITLRAELTLEPTLQEHIQALAVSQDTETEALALRLLHKELGDYFHNGLWAMPGHAYLLLHTRTQAGIGNASGEMDGQPMHFMPFTLGGVKLFWYARLESDRLGAGKHAVVLRLQNLQKNQFLGAFLDAAEYKPVKQYVKADPQIYYHDSKLNPDMAYEASPWKFLHTQIEPSRIPVTGGWAEISARLDAAAEDIACVIAENATLPAMQPMLYDSAADCYRAWVDVGNRRSNIMDGKYFYIWAKDSCGRYIQPACLAFSYIGAEEC